MYYILNILLPLDHQRFYWAREQCGKGKCPTRRAPMNGRESNVPAHVQSEDRYMPTSLIGAARPDLLADETTLARDRSIRSHLRWRLEREI